MDDPRPPIAKPDDLASTSSPLLEPLATPTLNRRSSDVSDGGITPMATERPSPFAAMTGERKAEEGKPTMLEVPKLQEKTEKAAVSRPPTPERKEPRLVLDQCALSSALC